VLGSQFHDVLALVHLEPTFPDSIGRELQFTHDHAVDQHFGTIGQPTEPLVVDLDDVTRSTGDKPPQSDHDERREGEICAPAGQSVVRHA